MSRSVLPGFSPDGRGDGGAALAEERYWDALVLGHPVSAPVDPAVGGVIHAILALDDAPQPDAAFAARLESQLLGTAPIALMPKSALGLDGEGETESAPRPAGGPVITRRRVLSVAATAALLVAVAGSVLVTLRAGSRAPLEEEAFPLVLGPGIRGETLLQARFEGYPDGPLGPDVEGWVIQPGAEVSMGEPGSSGEGPSAYLIESGTLTVASDGPIAVTRAGTLTPVAMAEPLQIDLHTGDRGFAPSGVMSTWRNNGADPVRVLEAAVKWRDDNVPYQDGVLNYTVISSNTLVRVDPPIVVTVFRLTLEPEAVLKVDSVPGLEMLKTEMGRLEAVDFDAAGSPQTPSPLGQATRSLGEFPPGRVFRSANDRPVSLLLVTIANTNPLGPGA